MSTRTGIEAGAGVSALSRWADGSAKRAIVEFVERVCGEGRSTGVPVDARPWKAAVERDFARRRPWSRSATRATIAT